MHALHDLVIAGKIRYLGASSMWAYQFAMMQAYAEKNGLTKFIAMQVRTESDSAPPTVFSGLLTREKNRYNLLYREEEREMIKYCNATGVAVVPVRRPLL
jgi:aryl-alcohol dehydrogenase-like predicted oxidoreductase